MTETETWSTVHHLTRGSPSPPSASPMTVGSKAANLLRIAQADLPAPPGSIFPTALCQEYHRRHERSVGIMEESQISSRIASIRKKRHKVRTKAVAAPSESVSSNPVRSHDPIPVDDEMVHVQLARQGCIASFEWLYQMHVKKIYNLILRIVRTTSAAEEVAQEVFSQAYRGLPRFEGRSRFYTWIFRIATNLALQHVRKSSREPRSTSLEALTEKAGVTAACPRDDPERIAERAEFLQRLQASLLRLTPCQRAIIALGPIQGHSYEEMAEILNVTLEVVKARLHRARERIREMMKKYR